MIPLTLISTGPNPYRHRVSYFSPYSKLLLIADTVKPLCQSYTSSPDQTPLFIPTIPFESCYSDPCWPFPFFHIFPQVQCPKQALVLRQCQSTRRSQHWTQSPSPCFWKHVPAAVGEDDAAKAMCDPPWPHHTFQWRPSNHPWVFCTAIPSNRDECQPTLKAF